MIKFLVIVFIGDFLKSYYYYYSKMTIYYKLLFYLSFLIFVEARTPKPGPARFPCQG